MSATETGRRGASSSAGGGQAQGGLFGSDIGTNPTRPATAELIGTFILVFTGIRAAR